MRWALLLLCVTSTAHAADWTNDWDALLKRHVDERGRVDYARLRADDSARLDRLVAAVGEMKSPDEASLLNAYNILVWRSVLPRISATFNVDKDKQSFFYDTKHLVAGENLSLADLETRIRTTYKDPRIHMALNCASLGCPRLPREAFRAQNLDAQLDREARIFCNEKRNVEVQPDGHIKLSQIFDWYRGDFVNVVAFINRYRPDGEKLSAGAKIDYFRYDWSLNSR
jgi:hypothetical protein